LLGCVRHVLELGYKIYSVVKQLLLCPALLGIIQEDHWH